ncbi:MAG TPA: 2-oxoacid:acceptor oxidoreductase family protein [Acidobacteriota bacterium]
MLCPNPSLEAFSLVHSKPRAFYDQFVRKGGNLDTTHYCPGCGHGILHKLIAEAIDDFQIQDRTVIINPVGCSVFLYYYFDVGNVQVAHGRAPAAATGFKRVRPDSIVISYQGDGDLAAIGLNEIVQAANRGEAITVFFVNNAIYGMTGGQMAPTTLLGQKTITSPYGRSVENEGFPLRMSELIATLQAPAYVERVALIDPKHILATRKAVRRALRNQIEARGFSFVEVLAACPTGWGLTPVESERWIADNMLPVFPLGRFVERDGEAHPPAPPAAIDPQALDRLLELDGEEPEAASGARHDRPIRIKVAGFGGQGVLLLGHLLAEAAMRSGTHVSWLPSYGPEMRGGTAHCHVVLSPQPIGSPICEHPDVLVALNRPSLDRFAAEVKPDGTILINSTLVDVDCPRQDVRSIALPFTAIADQLGELKVANVVALGALARLLGQPDRAAIEAAIPAKIKKTKLHALNLQAFEAGWSSLGGA